MLFNSSDIWCVFLQPRCIHNVFTWYLYVISEWKLLGRVSLCWSQHTQTNRDPQWSLCLQSVVSSCFCHIGSRQTKPCHLPLHAPCRPPPSITPKPSTIQIQHSPPRHTLRRAFRHHFGIQASHIKVTTLNWHQPPTLCWPLCRNFHPWSSTPTWHPSHPFIPPTLICSLCLALCSGISLQKRDLNICNIVIDKPIISILIQQTKLLQTLKHILHNIIFQQQVAEYLKLFYDIETRVSFPCKSGSTLHNIHVSVKCARSASSALPSVIWGGEKNIWCWHPWHSGCWNGITLLIVNQKTKINALF